ncbi:MAG: glycosyltransferase [Isosphaeraceae bacterium]
MAGSPVRVAHVVEALETGGLEKLLVEFVRHSERARFSHQVVALGERGRLADEIEALGCPVTALHARPGFKPSSWWRLARLFRKGRVDVVHTHSEGPLLFGVPAARLARVRRVVHTRHHGPDLGNPPHILKLMAAASRWADRVVCVADDGARHSLAEGFAPSRVMTVWNGIDLTRFAYQGPTPGGPAVAVGRLAPEKDHATLVRAAAIAAGSEPAFRVEIAGDGPCGEELRGLAAELGVGEVVRFLGRVDDVPGLLGRSGQLVLPSRMEGVSLTLLEAMARGLPVVATSVGGNPEVVAEGETGLLVPPGDPAALARAMLAVWRDPALARVFGRAGRARAEHSFDVRLMTARYEAIYTGEPDPVPPARRSPAGAEAALA